MAKAIREEYIEKNPRSAELFNKAKRFSSRSEP